MRRIIVTGLMLLLATGCTPAAAPIVTDPPAPSPVSPGPATSLPVPSITPSANDEQFTTLDAIELSEPTALPAAWSEVFTLPYGDAPERLGTSLGGDGEGLQWGPSYGTAVPDGTWWFLDTAHRRLAHYSDTGDYLGETLIPQQHLAQGEYVQYAVPLALADGTVVLQSSTPDDPGMLLMSPTGEFTRVVLPGFVAVKGTDGSSLYGFGEDGGPAQIDPRTGTITAVDAFTDQNVDDYALAVGPGRVTITRPGFSLDLPVTMAGNPAAVVHPSIEAAVGTDDVLNLLVVGLVEETPGEIVELAGFVRINADGLGLSEPVRPLTSPSDPADGLRLGVRLSDRLPWLMAIDTDAVRVYRRSA